MVVDETKSEKETKDSSPELVVQEATEQAAAGDKPKLKDVAVDGYRFKLDEELLDDVELLEFIDGIENGEQPALIITLLKKLIGDDGYEDMKGYFVKKDGRFKMSKLLEIYQAIFEDFDPKG